MRLKYILIGILIIALVSSCVSRKKYRILHDQYEYTIEKYDSLAEQHVATVSRNEVLLNDLSRLLKVSGVTTTAAISSTVLQAGSYRLAAKPICAQTDYLPIISSQVNTLLTQQPFNGVLRIDARINRSTKKQIYISSGFSKFLESNPRYETVIYMVNIYADKESNMYLVDVDFIPLVSGSASDAKSLLYREEQVNLYLSKIQQNMKVFIASVAEGVDCLNVIE